MTNTSKYKDLKQYDTVKYACHEWYVISIDNDTVTLLAKNDDFGGHRFDKSSSNYKISEIRNYLNTSILLDLESKGANLITTELSDVGVTDKVWLLSYNEAIKLPTSIGMRMPNGWWLRSPSKYPKLVNCPGDSDKKVEIATYVFPPSNSDKNYEHTRADDIGSYCSAENVKVRPAIRVSIDELIQ